jgi:hypothetical protein
VTATRPASSDHAGGGVGADTGSPLERRWALLLAG